MTATSQTRMAMPLTIVGQGQTANEERELTRSWRAPAPRDAVASLAARIAAALALPPAPGAPTWPATWGNDDHELIVWGAWLGLSSRTCAIAITASDQGLLVHRIAPFVSHPAAAPRLPGPTAADWHLLHRVDAALDGALLLGLTRARETALLAWLQAAHPD